MNRQATMFVISVIALLMFVSCGNNEVSEPKTDEPINFEIITEDTAFDEIAALFSIGGRLERHRPEIVPGFGMDSDV